MDSSHVIILDYQRRSLFSVILSSSIPFCMPDYFISNNKDAVRHHNTKGVNHISSHPFPFHLESSLNKNKNKILIKIIPFFNGRSFLSSCSFLYFYLQQSSSANSTGNANGSLSSTGGDHSSKTDGTQSTGSTTQPIPHPSHIVTNQSPYQISYHNNHYHHGNRSHHRGTGYPRNEPLPKKPTGIPRDGLIQIPRHIPGALRDQTGAPVVPRQMA
jgi:hypothetical protein